MLAIEEGKVAELEGSLASLRNELDEAEKEKEKVSNPNPNPNPNPNTNTNTKHNPYT